MNNYLLIIIYSLLFTHNIFAAAHMPEDQKGQTKELNIRSFYKINEKTWAIAEVEIKDPSYDKQFRALRLGSRYSLSDNFKFGLFVGRVEFQKHHDNWIREDGVWKWNNDQNKNETIFYPELSYRDLFKDLVYEIKLKYILSSLFDEKDLFIKFNLMYSASTKWQIIASDEVKTSLTNKEKTLLENWIYLSPFYKLNPHLFLGPTIGYFKRFWTTSAFHKSLRSDTYQSNDSSTSIGFNINFYLN